MTDPALIYDQRPPAGVGAHVIIIGVGAYDHLLGGDDEKFHIADNMGQLSSPPISARELASWFLDGRYVNPDKPLASLSLVLSEPNPASFDHPARTTPKLPLPHGETMEVVDAIDAWAARAASHPDNLAIFYFSGHGVSVADPLLLCRDYGRQDANRFRGALNFEGFRSAMETRSPTQQLYLIDACRTPADLSNTTFGRANLGDSALAPDDPASQGRALARQSVHLATSAWSTSWGVTNQPTFYTRAILEALDGGGAQSDQSWWVGTNGLQLALGAYTSRLAAEQGVEQLPDRLRAPMFRIHKPSAIKVPLRVDCDPEAVWSADFLIQVKSGRRLDAEYLHNPVAEATRRSWVVRVPADKYTITATFAGGARYQDATVRHVLAVPPETPLTLKVRPKRR